MGSKEQAQQCAQAQLNAQYCAEAGQAEAAASFEQQARDAYAQLRQEHTSAGADALVGHWRREYDIDTGLPET